MAVPTLDQLHEFIDELVVKHQPPDQFAVFEPEYLAKSAWRHFRTTSPAIRSRISQLVEDGKLARVKISESGFVYTGDEVLDQGLFSLYFQYANPHGYRHMPPTDYGFVTAKRTEGHRNVWRDGLRYLYTTAEQHRLMIEHFREVKVERARQQQDKEDKERRRTAELLESSSPGGQQVLSDLYERLDNGKAHLEVEADVRERRDGSLRLGISIDTRTTEQSVALLEIIRRGLAGSEES